MVEWLTDQSGFEDVLLVELYTLCLLTCKLRVTVGSLGLCYCVRVMSFKLSCCWDQSVVSKLVIGLLFFLCYCCLVVLLLLFWSSTLHEDTELQICGCFCFRTLQRKLVPLFLKNKRDTDPAWICSIPLLHLLCEENLLFNAPPPSEIHRSKVWWGTTQVDEKVQAFKEATQHIDWKQWVITFKKTGKVKDPSYIIIIHCVYFYY